MPKDNTLKQSNSQYLMMILMHAYVIDKVPFLKSYKIIFYGTLSFVYLLNPVEKIKKNNMCEVHDNKT